MSTRPLKVRTAVSFLPLVLFAIAGWVLYQYARGNHEYSEAGHIYDLIWLDAWALLYFCTTVLLWLGASSERVRGRLLMSALAMFGVVYVALEYHGTVFGYNGDFGDQQFRLAMIQKFVTFGTLTDFFYRDLPSFYPPVYYYLLALWSRVFSVDHTAMLKAGSMLIYAAGPFLMYWLWRKLVSPLQASLVVLATYLLCAEGNPYLQSVPHAFLSNSLFIPWWLHYLEGVGGGRLTWRVAAVGGLTGGLLFGTYFYPFFILTVMVVGRLVLQVWPRLRSHVPKVRIGRLFMVLGAAAAVSLPYWLPAIVSISEFGMDRSRGGWHHIGTTGFALSFMQWSLVGVLPLLGIVYSAVRRRSRLHQLLLALLVTVLAYQLLGSILGAVDKEVNLIKSREFMRVFGAVFVGLSMAGCIRAVRTRRVQWTALATLLLVCLLVVLNGANSVAKEAPVKTARTTVIPDLGLSASWAERASGSVVLSGYHVLPSYYPVYTFLNTNEHYAHPASRFARRYGFLRSLSAVRDPALFYIALRHNVFDQVDWILPRPVADNFEMLVRLSAYPNGHDNRTLKFPLDLLKDTSWFVPEEGGRVYRLKERASGFGGQFSGPLGAGGQLGGMEAAAALGAFLTPIGDSLLDEYVGTGGGCEFQQLEVDSGRLADYVDEVVVLAVHDGDSTLLSLNFRIKQDFTDSYGVFLHRYPMNSDSGFVNLDFVTSPPTGSWRAGEVVACRRTVPRDPARPRWHFGLFSPKGRLGHGIWVTLSDTVGNSGRK